jgi:hypothetical protein
MARCPAHSNRIQLNPSRAVNLFGATPQPDCRWIAGSAHRACAPNPHRPGCRSVCRNLERPWRILTHPTRPSAPPQRCCHCWSGRGRREPWSRCRRDAKPSSNQVRQPESLPNTRQCTSAALMPQDASYLAAMSRRFSVHPMLKIRSGSRPWHRKRPQIPSSVSRSYMSR